MMFDQERVSESMVSGHMALPRPTMGLCSEWAETKFSINRDFHLFRAAGV
jgi:hypothetical protein